MKKVFLNLLLLFTFLAVINTTAFANAPSQEGPLQSLEKKLTDAENQPPKEENNLSIISFINRNSNYVVGLVLIAGLIIVFYPNKKAK